MKRGHGGRRSDTVRPAQACGWHLRQRNGFGPSRKRTQVPWWPGDYLAVRQPERPLRVEQGPSHERRRSRRRGREAVSAAKSRTTGALFSSGPRRPHVLVWPWEERPTSVATTRGGSLRRGTQDSTSGCVSRASGRAERRLGLSCVLWLLRRAITTKAGPVPPRGFADALFVDLRSVTLPVLRATGRDRDEQTRDRSAASHNDRGSQMSEHGEEDGIAKIRPLRRTIGGIEAVVAERGRQLERC